MTKFADKQRDPAAVQHVFHSGWNTDQEGAEQNAATLREQLAERGVVTDEADWTVYSDPKKHQVLKNKGLWPKGAISPTSMLAARHMADSTLAGTDTVWHGHSQGGAQLTAATEMALEMMTQSKQVRRKAKNKLKDMTPEEQQARLGIDSRGNRVNWDKDLLGGEAFEHLSAEQQKAELKAMLRRENAEKRLNQHNAFSYSGAASNPHEAVDHARSAHRRGDPVSGWVANVTPGPSFKQGKDADRAKTKKGMWRPLQVQIGNHGYEENYAGLDAMHTKQMLGNMGLLSEEAQETEHEEEPTVRRKMWNWAKGLVGKSATDRAA